MKILCYINHFFGQSSHFRGKSSLSPELAPAEVQRRAEMRKNHVEMAIAQARKLGDVDLKVCGIEGQSLVPLDLRFDKIRDKPLLLIYETMNSMAEEADEYDYFINMEDDVLIPEATFSRIVEFDKVSLVNEIFLPNRLEQAGDGKPYCVDLLAIPGWTQQRKKFKEMPLRVAVNPHSGLIILSREKLKYALKYLDRNFREPILYNELDSAFAYWHSPFSLFRSEDAGYHFVNHLDKWSHSPGEAPPDTWTKKIQRIGVLDFIPPILVRLYSLTKKRIS